VAPVQRPVLALQVARLFFDRRMTRIEIAAHLGISRFRVARLLDGALADGLVRVEYRDLPVEDRDLARRLEDRFGLSLCAVAAEGPTAPLGAVAELAGSLLDGLIGPDETVGIAWGSTLAAVVAAVPPRHDPSIRVVQLAGSSSRLVGGRDAGELTRALADRLGAAHHAIYAPAFVDSAGVREALVRAPEVADAVGRFGDISLAIVGIGAVPADGVAPASSLLRSGVLDASDIRRLVGLGAIGELVVHPFDRDGRFVDAGLADRAIAIDIERLRAIRRVVAVASGPAKAAAIRGALASGVVAMLVTDAATARAVLTADDRARATNAHD
jgi:DNA-binding transcriptional regulator LsrR (DeoR family)